MEHFDAPVHELNTDRVSDSRNTVVTDIKGLSTSVTEGVETVRETASDIAGGVKDAVSSTAARIRGAAQTVKGDVEDVADAASSKLRAVAAETRALAPTMYLDSHQFEENPREDARAAAHAVTADIRKELTHGHTEADLLRARMDALDRDERTAYERAKDRAHRDIIGVRHHERVSGSPDSGEHDHDFFHPRVGGGTVHSDFYEAAASARHDARMHQAGHHDSKDSDSKVVVTKEIRDPAHERGRPGDAGDLRLNKIPSQADRGFFGTLSDVVRSATGGVVHAIMGTPIRAQHTASSSEKAPVVHAPHRHAPAPSTTPTAAERLADAFGPGPADPSLRQPGLYRSGSLRNAPPHALSRNQFAPNDPALVAAPGDDALSATDISDALAEAGAVPLRGITAAATKRSTQARAVRNDLRYIADDAWGTAPPLGASASDVAGTTKRVLRGAVDEVEDMASRMKHSFDDTLTDAQRAAGHGERAVSDTIRDVRDTVAEVAAATKDYFVGTKSAAVTKDTKAAVRAPAPAVNAADRAALVAKASAADDKAKAVRELRLGEPKGTAMTGDHHQYMGDLGHLGDLYAKDPTRGLDRPESKDTLLVGARPPFDMPPRDRLTVDVGDALDAAGAPLSARGQPTPAQIKRPSSSAVA